MEEYAIIVAGGIGSRMKSEVPKQFLLIDDVPIIVHSISSFLNYDDNINIIVVLPEAHIDRWKEIKSNYFSDIEIRTVSGGLTRSASVLSGLTLIKKDGLVAIHDAVRPYVSSRTISESFKSAKDNGSGVSAVELKDSIRELENDSSVARDRSKYVLVQTPQTFRIDDLKKAYEKVGVRLFTDDASVFEAAGYKVTLVKGSYDNIKITTPEDLK
ncbi:2-C-methyl-D-erythritol 4-phosphate cytidylyltransferase [Ekhidna sp.]